MLFWKSSLVLSFSIVLGSVLISPNALLAMDESPAATEIPTPADIDRPDVKYPEIRTAVERLREGDGDGALEHLRKAAAKYPELPPADVQLADILVRNRKIPQAHALLERAARTEPDLPDAYVLLGNIAAMQRRFVEAQLLYSKALELVQKFAGDPGRKRRLELQGQVGLGIVAMNHERWRDAEKHYRVWLEMAPEQGQAYVSLARVLFRDKRGKEALATLKEGYKADPSIGEPPLLVAAFYSETGDLQKAEQWLQYAVKNSPTNVDTRMTLARWYWSRGNVAEVRKHTEAAVKADPDAAASQYLLAALSRYEGKDNEAEEILEKLVRDKPGEFSASNLLALTLVAGDNPARLARARMLAEKNLREHSNNAEAISTLGWIYFHLGEMKKAEELYTAVEQTRYSDPNTRYYAAEWLVHKGDNEKAKEVLNELLKTTSLFIYRREAEALLNKLENSAPPIGLDLEDALPE